MIDCNHSKDMKTEKDVLNHLNKECKKIPKKKCKDCDKDIDRNVVHNCFENLKLSLEEER